MNAYLDIWNSDLLNQPNFNFAKGVERWFNRFSPSLDVEETETQYLVTLDTPGVSKDDVKIEVLDDQLVVTGEKRFEKNESKHTRHVSEREFGKFQRTLTLPHPVDAEKVSAEYKDGVLRISIAKAEAAKPKQIEIR